jgi:hypothetical protein
MEQLIIILITIIIIILGSLVRYVYNFINQQENVNNNLQKSLTNFETSISESINILAGPETKLTTWVIKGDPFGNLCFGNPKFFACIESSTGNLISPPTSDLDTPIPIITSPIKISSQIYSPTISSPTIPPIIN